MNTSTRKFSLIIEATIRSAAILIVLVGFGVSSTFAQPRAYVVNRNNVSVIDSVTNTVVATVPIEGAGDVAITPDGAFAYLTTPNHTVTVLDTATNTVVATVPVGPGPSAIAITPNGWSTCLSNAVIYSSIVITRVHSQNIESLTPTRVSLSRTYFDLVERHTHV